MDLESAKVIRFTNASKSHQQMVGKILKPEQGLTHSVFKEEEAPPESEEAPEGQAKEEVPKSVYVKEVVREPKMHFYNVPRLGCFMAIALKHKSCLFEDALDAAVSDY